MYDNVVSDGDTADIQKLILIQWRTVGSLIWPLSAQGSKKTNLSASSNQVLDMSFWMSDVFKMSGDMDPRTGTIWLSHDLYPTRRTVYEDYANSVTTAPSKSAFYKVIYRNIYMFFLILSFNAICLANAR